MSVKAYNGFLVQQNFVEFLNALNDTVKPKAIKLVEQKLIKFMARETITLFDKIQFKLIESKEKGLLVQVWMDVMERQRKVKQTHLRDPEIDFGSEIGIYSVNTNNSLIRVFTEHDEILNLFNENFPNIKDVSYWDNTDRPDNVSAKEWSKRKRMWKPYWFKKCDLVYHLIENENATPIPKPKEIIENLPSIDFRARCIALEIMLSKTLNEKDTKEIKMYEVCSAISDIKGSPLFQEKVKEISNQLKININETDIT